MVQNMFAKYGCVAEPCAGTRLGRLGRRWDDAGTTLHLALVALALVALGLAGAEVEDTQVCNMVEGVNMHIQTIFVVYSGHIQ